MRGSLAAAVAAVLLVLGVSGCSAGDGESGAPPASTFFTTGGTGPSQTPNPYALYDQQVQALLHAVATWSTPKHSTADTTERIGLSFGSIAALKPQIDQLIPKATRTAVGTFEVGPTMSVQLTADPSDATIAAPTTLDKSTGTSVHYLFTWQVRPLHPSSAMLFTATVTIPLSNGRTDSYDIPLSLRVDRTFGYTAHQVFASWATWVSIATVLVAVAGWVWRRRRTFERSRRGAAAQPRKGRRRTHV